MEDYIIRIDEPECLNTSFDLHNLCKNKINGNKNHLCGTCKFNKNKCKIDKSNIPSFPDYTYMFKVNYKFNHDSCLISKEYIDYLKRKLLVRTIK